MVHESNTNKKSSSLGRDVASRRDGTLCQSSHPRDDDVKHPFGLCNNQKKEKKIFVFFVFLIHRRVFANRFLRITK